MLKNLVLDLRIGGRQSLIFWVKGVLEDIVNYFSQDRESFSKLFRAIPTSVVKPGLTASAGIEFFQ